jgi:DNA-binding Lrp family transcriptional regulator
MNVGAYVLIETEPGKNREVARKLETIPGILSAYPVTGPYDVIAAITFKHLENMTGIVLPAVGLVPGVKKTITCIREDAQSAG